MEEIKKSVQQTLVVAARKSLSLNSVKTVECMDDGFISLMTDGGVVSVEGENLKIESLSKDGGNIQISGRINGVYYNDEPSKRSSIFNRRAK